MPKCGGRSGSCARGAAAAAPGAAAEPLPPAQTMDIRQRLLPEHGQSGGCGHRVGHGGTRAARDRSAHAVHSDCTRGGYGHVDGWRTRTGRSGHPDSRSRSQQPRGRALHGDDGSWPGGRKHESHERRRNVLAAGCGTGWIHGACADRTGHRTRRRPLDSRDVGNDGDSRRWARHQRPGASTGARPKSVGNDGGGRRAVRDTSAANHRICVQSARGVSA